VAQAGGLAAPARAYLDELAARFERAAEAAGLLEDDLEIAGVPMRLRFAGPALRDVLLPPFEHLGGEVAGAPALRISVFDSATTGVEPPIPPWEPISAEPGTNPLARLRSESVCVLAAGATGAITAADVGAGEAVFNLPDAGRISPIERAAPLREALQLLMTPRGRCMTHAGAVGLDGCGTLLVGRGGSGKSTLSLACALAGMEIVADDYVLLETGPAVAHAMQSTAKLTEASASLLGLGADVLPPEGFEPTVEGPPKAIVDIAVLAPGALRKQLGITALVAPRIDAPGRAELGPISAAQALRALAPSTVLQSGADGRATLSALGELVREVPCYELRLSTDLPANAAVLRDLVAAHA
jgi:hypothetical protein